MQVYAATWVKGRFRKLYVRTLHAQLVCCIVKVCRVLYSRNVTIETSQHLSIIVFAGVASCQPGLIFRRQILHMYSLDSCFRDPLLWDLWWPQFAVTTDLHQVVFHELRPSILQSLPLCYTRLLASSTCRAPLLRAHTGITVIHSFFQFLIELAENERLEWDTWACRSWIPNSGSQHFHYSSPMLHAFTQLSNSWLGYQWLGLQVVLW